MILIHACVVGRILRRGFLSTNSVNTTERSSSSSGTSMSKGDIEKLPCFDFKGTSSSSADCAVCLEIFRVGDKCRLLPFCKHSFHAECVDLWLLRTPICPICRAGAEVAKGGGPQESNGSNEIRDGQTTGTAPGNRSVVIPGIQATGTCETVIDVETREPRNR